MKHIWRHIKKESKEGTLFHLPIIITEKGIAICDSQKKIKLIKKQVDILGKCLRKGRDIRGYFY